MKNVSAIALIGLMTTAFSVQADEVKSASGNDIKTLHEKVTAAKDDPTVQEITKSKADVDKNYKEFSAKIDEEFKKLDRKKGESDRLGQNEKRKERREEFDRRYDERKRDLARMSEWAKSDHEIAQKEMDERVKKKSADRVEGKVLTKDDNKNEAAKNDLKKRDHQLFGFYDQFSSRLDRIVREDRRFEERRGEDRRFSDRREEQREDRRYAAKEKMDDLHRAMRNQIEVQKAEAARHHDLAKYDGAKYHGSNPVQAAAPGGFNGEGGAASAGSSVASNSGSSSGGSNSGANGSNSNSGNNGGGGYGRYASYEQQRHHHH